MVKWQNNALSKNRNDGRSLRSENTTDVGDVVDPEGIYANSDFVESALERWLTRV